MQLRVRGLDGRSGASLFSEPVVIEPDGEDQHGELLRSTIESYEELERELHDMSEVLGDVSRKLRDVWARIDGRLDYLNGRYD